MAADSPATANRSLTREAIHAERYEALARLLLAADDPVVAIAHELGDQHGRIDALAARLSRVESGVSYLREAGR